MAGARLGPVLRDLGSLFRTGTTVGLTDAQLLDRFVADRDEAAFAALVARHGAFVLAVCRDILRLNSRRGGCLPGHVPDPGQEGKFAPRQ